MTTTPLHELLGRSAVVVFDVETTGTSHHQDRVIEIAAVRWDGQGRREFSVLVNPGFEVLPAVVQLTGITNEMLTGAPDGSEAFRQFSEFAQGAPLLIAHNAQFDLGFLWKELSRWGLSLLRYDFICTRALAMFTGTGIKRPNRGGYMMLGTKLEEVAEALNITLEGAHRALNDVRATEAILPPLYRKALAQHRPILNALVHPQWLVDKGVTEPDYLPPRAVLYLTA